MFCKTCGSLLALKKTPYGKWMSCPQDHGQPELNQKSITITSKNIHQAKEIKVSGDENILAVYDHLCKKCGYNKTELIEISCSYSDEDNIYQMKCGQCGHVEQLEGKVK